jgi:hypothetical protein
MLFIMAKFLSDLDARLKDDDTVWVLDSPLKYQSDIMGLIEVPSGFETDFASVPRVPFVYEAFGDRAHRESVLHDYLYRIDSIPQATFDQANDVFLEAMTVRNKGWFVRKMMYWGVCCGGSSSYHKKMVGDKL